MDNQICYIEFEFQQDKYFDDLVLVFEKLQAAKNNNQPQSDEFWLKSFPDYSIKHFFFLSTDLKPNFETAEQNEFTWHFYSLIDLLQTNYDIEYTNCIKLMNNKGRLEYHPFGYPYGGATGIIIFVKSFNCKPTIIDDGTGVYRIDLFENGDYKLTALAN